MDLLDVARGPGLWLAGSVFVGGVCWRLVGILRRPRMPDLSAPRAGAPSAAVSAVSGIVRGLRLPQAFGAGYRIARINGMVMHLGLALVVLGYAPHIAFIKRITGLSWPALPDVVMYVAAGLTIFSLIVALVRRLNDAVLKLISSADDWITWTVTVLPFLTGMGLINESSSRIASFHHVVYRGPLAVHLLTLELLLIWFPFGKLMHAVLYPFSRAATGMRFGHRGVRA